MKSVGEVMGIGRSFQEACIKHSIIRNKKKWFRSWRKGYTNYEQIIEKLTLQVGIVFLWFMMLLLLEFLWAVSMISLKSICGSWNNTKSSIPRKEISTYKVETLPKNCCWKRNKSFADRLHMMRCLESQVHTLGWQWISIVCSN
jgi:carbamoyl-phosphate synthase large subunit